MTDTRDQRLRGYSLVEMVVSMAILSLILVLLSMVLQSTSNTWIRTKETATQFRDAREAFEYLTRNLQQATLNTYWDFYYDETQSNVPPVDNNTPPSRQAPSSELHFLTGPAAELLDDDERYRSHAIFFQAPLGKSTRFTDLNNLLNARGYFVEFGDDLSEIPDFLTRRIEPRYRFRLKEFRPPAEENVVYLDALEEVKADAARPVQLNQWYRPDSKLYRERLPYEKIVRTVAENVVLLIVLPRWSIEEARTREAPPSGLTPFYRYNSYTTPPAVWNDPTRHQLPPLIDLILVTIPEKAAASLAAQHGTTPPPELTIPSELFARSAILDQDLDAYEAQLTSENVPFRIFRNTLRLQAAKWTDATF